MRRAGVWISEVIASGFGSGRFPVAPGTAGTAAAMAIVIGLFRIVPESANAWSTGMLAVATTVVGIAASNVVCRERVFGESKDPKQVVIDEFAGFFFTIMGAGSGARELIWGFFLFRFFDVTKLPPIRRIERLPAGYGIVLDDVLAGIYANMVLRVLMHFF